MYILSVHNLDEDMGSAYLYQYLNRARMIYVPQSEITVYQDKTMGGLLYK